MSLWKTLRLLGGSALCGILLAVPASGGEEAFVTNQNGNTVAIVGLDQMAVAAKLTIPGNPVGIAVTRDGSRVYVTSSEGKTLSVIDAAERNRAMG